MMELKPTLQPEGEYLLPGDSARIQSLAAELESLIDEAMTPGAPPLYIGRAVDGGADAEAYGGEQFHSLTLAAT